MAAEFGVAAKAVIFKDKKVLLISKSESEDINPNTWDIPGGRLEFRESPREALHREVREETGLDITILGPSRTWTFTKGEFQLVGITFCCLTKGKVTGLSNEHVKFRWMGIDELKEETFPDWILKEISAAKTLFESRKR